MELVIICFLVVIIAFRHNIKDFFFREKTSSYVSKYQYKETPFFGYLGLADRSQYRQEQKRVEVLRKEEARVICQEIVSVMNNNKPRSYRNSYTTGTDNHRYGRRLKIYTEFGELGYFSYVVLDGCDVIDFISRYFCLDKLLDEGKILEKPSVHEYEESTEILLGPSIKKDIKI